MSPQPLNVMFLWHMHQPYYKDVASNEYLMPWVGLHATKDYLDMPLLAAKFPNVRMTFNMVPSLLEQIGDYAAGTANDAFLRLARKRAEELTEDERSTLLQDFFSAQPDRMIRPHPRYQELYERRGWTRDKNELRRIAQSFGAADLRDLQAWLFLAWVDPLLRARDPRLAALVKKDRLFSEQEKHELLDICRAIAGEIVPTMRRLADEGRIEISTTPYFHPILPLLVDTDFGRRARPRLQLPSRRFTHPEDARLQIKLGLDYCEQLFGTRPRGMWPSEGSVCPELIPMFAAEGVQWIASDEDILACSMGDERFWRDKDGLLNNMGALYAPSRAQHAGAEVAMFFRDRALSDQIGFKYLNWNPGDAAADFIRRLEEIQYLLRDAEQPHTVSVILDGENCWEHYEDDGQPFLRALYGALNEHPYLRTVTPSQLLAEQQIGASRTIVSLHSGSWINHDFGIWIGHPEDNASWNLLAQAREDIGKLARPPEVLPPDKIPGAEDTDELRAARAWKSLMIAEGSDWNWWYGDDHSSGIDDQFDELYRRHLRSAYEQIGIEPPARLLIPISSVGDTGLQTQPTAFLSPTLDGRNTSYYEWFSAGRYDPSRGGDSMHQGEHAIAALYFGFDLENFYLRADLDEVSSVARAPQAEFVIYLFAHKNYMIAIALDEASSNGAAALVPRIYEEKASGGWQEIESRGAACCGRIIEARLPLVPFEITPGEMLRFQVSLESAGRPQERCPARTPLATLVPGRDFEEELWIV